jgi:hypothetical protein
MAWASGVSSAETHLQAWSALTGHDGQRRRSKVQANGVLAHRVPGFLIRDASERQLHAVALARSIGPSSTWAAGLANHQSGVFDRVCQPVGHHGILPIDERGDLVVLPHQIPGVALLGRLEHEAQSGIIALVLDAGEASSSTLEAHPVRLAQTDSVERAIGACGQRLRQHRIHMVAGPACS